MIKERLLSIRQKIAASAIKAGRSPEDITLVAVTKLFPAEMILEALSAGQKYFGENYVQELVEKQKQVPKEAQFHFIGHLQTNKAKHVVELCSLIETVDSFKLGHALNMQAEKLQRILDILIQVNIGDDPNKSGIEPKNTEHLLRQLNGLKNLRVCGLMTIPPLSDNPENSRIHFRNLKKLADKLREAGFLNEISKLELSMGMSDDFHIAIEEGATIVRVGTAIFGHRK